MIRKLSFFRPKEAFHISKSPFRDTHQQKKMPGDCHSFPEQTQVMSEQSHNKRRFLMQYPCVIDSQRRLAIPKPWRLDTDTEETEFYVALGTGPSLEFYDYEEFEKRQRISRQNINTKEKRILNMGAGSLSMIVQLDKQGRFSIPQPMLEAAQIHTNVLCLGATNYATIIAVEIWDKIKPSLDEIISYNEMLSADNSVVNIETKVMVTETQ